MLVMRSDQHRATALLGLGRTVWHGLSPESSSAVHRRAAVE